MKKLFLLFSFFLFIRPSTVIAAGAVCQSTSCITNSGTSGVGTIGQTVDGAFSAIKYASVAGPATSDLVPAKHLSNLIGKTSAIVAIVGDSTMTDIPVFGNFVDPTATPWNLLQQKLRADNPQITSWTFKNFAINGSSENNFLQSTNTSGLTPPSWFTNPASTWVSYVQSASPDILFYCWGTNAATSGINGGTTAATYIRQNLEAVNAWSKVPNVVMVTNKDDYSVNDSGALDDANASAHQAQAAFHRTFALTNAAGYTSFPNVTRNGIGLVDLSEGFSRAVRGFSPRNQYLVSQPSALTPSRALGLWSQSVGSSTVGYTQNGDFRLVFRCLACGGVTLNNYGGYAIAVTMSPFLPNILRLNIGGDGGILPTYIVDGALGGAPSQSGSYVTTTLNQDVTFII